MSQEKVDRHKQEKANRKKVMRKQRGHEHCEEGQCLRLQPWHLWHGLDIRLMIFMSPGKRGWSRK